MDDVFNALRHPHRRALLDRLRERNGQSLAELCDGLGIARQSVSKHLAVLARANLVATTRSGRRTLHYLNPAPINDIAERWINQYDRERVRALADLKRALEEPSMADPQFVYVTYIRTTPRQLWRALTEPQFTRRYWGLAFTSEWTPGATMTWDRESWSQSDPEQVVLEAEPYTRLSYTWHSFTPEWNRNAGFDQERFEKLAAEPRSRVRFELEPVGEFVKLTVVHDGFVEGSTVIELISQGWPRVLSGLKTLLETGDVEALV